MVRYPRKRLEYEKARLLRAKGFSYNEILKELRVSKSILSLWCRDVVLSKSASARIEKRRASFYGQKLGALANKIKREKEIFLIKVAAGKEIKKVSWKSFRLIGAMLYWAEGSKSNGTAITNSDPRVI